MSSSILSRYRQNFLTHKFARETRKKTYKKYSSTYICIFCNNNILFGKCDKIEPHFHSGDIIDATRKWSCCGAIYNNLYKNNGCKENIFLTYFILQDLFIANLIVDKIFSYYPSILYLQEKNNDKLHIKLHKV